MEVVEKFDFERRTPRGMYTVLYREFLALPQGTVAKFSRGEDFEVDAKKFALSFRSGLWTRGLKAHLSVRGDDVYVQVVGPVEDKETSARRKPASSAVRDAVKATA